MSRAPEGMPPHPEVDAMLICDQAIREEITRKVSLIGIFENIFVAGFPAGHASLSVYLKLVDAQGEYDLVLELVRVGDLVVIGRGGAHASIANRLEPTEIVFHLSWLVFEQPGSYEFRLFANGRHVALKTFKVVQLAGPSVAQGGTPDG